MRRIKIAGRPRDYIFASMHDLIIRGSSVKTSFAAGEMVAEAMRRKPAIIKVFMRHGMACVGCAIGPYHTLAEASAEYGLDLDAFLRELGDAQP